MITYKNTRGVVSVYLEKKKIGHIGIEVLPKGHLAFRYYTKNGTSAGAHMRSLELVKISLEGA